MNGVRLHSAHKGKKSWCYNIKWTIPRGDTATAAGACVESAAWGVAGALRPRLRPIQLLQGCRLRLTPLNLLQDQVSVCVCRRSERGVRWSGEWGCRMNIWVWCGWSDWGRRIHFNRNKQKNLDCIHQDTQTPYDFRGHKIIPCRPNVKYLQG